VVLSIFSHGLSAMPGISIYARKVAALESSAPERQELGTKGWEECGAMPTPARDSRR